MKIIVRRYVTKVTEFESDCGSVEEVNELLRPLAMAKRIGVTSVVHQGEGETHVEYLGADGDRMLATITGTDRQVLSLDF